MRIIKALIADLDRIEPARYLNDWCRLAVDRKMRGKPLRIDRGRGNHHPQIMPTGPLKQALQIPQQEVDVEASLVRLVHDDGVVLPKAGIRLGLCQQHAIGHQLERCARRESLAKANLVAHMGAERRADFLGDSCCHRGGRDPARLGMADQPGLASPRERTDLGQLRGFARAGFPAHDHHRRFADGPGDHLGMRRHRQGLGKRKRRQRCARRGSGFHAAKL